ncbi:MAG TPA: imidazolonepropionase, partial [Gemmatimonadales bacterium]|nr:imidazolonepropionase [Gemmatimonadales bacterium]
MRVLRNIGQLATCRAEGGQGAIHVIPQAALVWQDDTILWCGPELELPLVHETAESEDAHGRLVVPGLVDCHTHLAFGGWRADEFERRLAGESYLDIAQAGGGIASTVRATRAASEEELFGRARAMLAEMRALGVTTVECKSGYGLD